MTTQQRFWGYADTETTQRELYDGQPVVSDVGCVECGRLLVETAGGYWACVMGHGRLNLEYVEDEELTPGLYVEDDNES